MPKKNFFGPPITYNKPKQFGNIFFLYPISSKLPTFVIRKCILSNFVVGISISESFRCLLFHPFLYVFFVFSATCYCDTDKCNGTSAVATSLVAILLALTSSVFLHWNLLVWTFIQLMSPLSLIGMNSRTIKIILKHMYLKFWTRNSGTKYMLILWGSYLSLHSFVTSFLSNKKTSFYFLWGTLIEGEGMQGKHKQGNGKQQPLPFHIIKIIQTL